MRHSPLPFLVFAVVAITACSDRTPAPATPAAPEAVSATPSPSVEPAPTPAAEAMPTPPATEAAMLEADYLGRWTGVEGMYLDIASKPGGGVRVQMQWDLDHRGTFDGSVTAEGLRFMRDGVAETAVPGIGDATGLKYLAGKQDCLVVKPGEAYCRD